MGKSLDKKQEEMTIVQIDQLYKNAVPPASPKFVQEIPDNIKNDAIISSVSGTIVSVGLLASVLSSDFSMMSTVVVGFTLAIPTALFITNIFEGDNGSFRFGGAFRRIFKPKKRAKLIEEKKAQNQLLLTSFKLDSQNHKKKIAKITKMTLPILNEINTADEFYEHYLIPGEGWSKKPKSGYTEKSIAVQKVLDASRNRLEITA